MKTSLNHTYRLVWSDALQTFVPVAECARGRGKGGKKSARARSLLLGIALLSGAAVHAQLPTGGQVVAGSASMASQGNTLTITQTSERMAADWQSFSIGQGHTVNFVQPSSSAVALNRVLGSDVSVIQGALNANGQVFLVNPNGVLFTKDAQVNVGGIVASTLNISTQDFMAGHYKFEGASSNAIVNQGNIAAHGNGQGGGTVALIAARISNEGTLTAEKGNVLMGAGRKVTLDLGGPVKIQVEEGALDALIEQGGAIKADGGLVYLSAKSAGDLVSTVINHTGITEAQTLATGEKGEIYLMGDMAKGRVSVGGTLKAEGGFIETSSAKVQVQEGAQIRAGHWLIDPYDFVVAKSGGDITGADLSNALMGGSVTIQTLAGGVSCSAPYGITCGTGNSTGNGDIFINDSVRLMGTSSPTLTLNAHRNIEINAPINLATNFGGKLALHYGQGEVAEESAATYTIRAPITLQSSGAADGNNGANQTNFSVKFGSDGTPINYTVLNSQSALQAMTLNGKYALGSSLTFSGNWTPIGNEWSNCTTMFCGSFDGLGNTISNLSTTGLVTPNWGDGLGGLFGATLGATIRNLNLENAAINLDALTTNVFYIGTLVGVAEHTYIHNVTATGSVTAPSGKTDYTGGLVGYTDGAQSRIDSSHATVNVTGGFSVGGLLGYAAGGLVTRSSARGNITAVGAEYVGGLVGFNDATISNSYAIGGVNAIGGNSVGLSMGGLVGHNNGGKSIDYAYSTGRVTNNSTTSTLRIGGLVGNNQGSVFSSFWDNEATGQASAFGANSSNQLATALVQETNNAYTQSEYNGFDFASTWWMAEGATRPFLRSEWRQNITNAHELQLVSLKPTLSYTLANDINLAASLTKASEMWKGESTEGNFQGSWSPIADGNNAFSGTFEGRGSEISNLFIRSDGAQKNYGLFDTIRDGTVDSLTLRRGSVTYTGNSTPSVGALAGKVLGGSEIRFVNADRVAVEGYNDVGGLVGVANGDSEAETTVQIITSRASGSVKARGSVAGGLVGDARYFSIDDSEATRGDVETASNAGGLVGYAQNGSITNSSAAGRVLAEEESGGLVGVARNVEMVWSWAQGNVQGQYAMGGLVGIADEGTRITNSNASGSVQGTEVVGGLVGLAVGGTEITSSFASGAVSGTYKVGGLIGEVDSTNPDARTIISGSSASGTVGTAGSPLAASYVGGLVGRMLGYVEVDRSYATAPVHATGSYVGGLIGAIEDSGAETRATVSSSYANGAVRGDENVGGLIGAVYFADERSAATIVNTYASGAVSGVSGGGLVGYLSAAASVDKSYSVGTVGAGFGGLIGQNQAQDQSNLTASYWDKETAGTNSSAGGAGKTTAEMKNIALYSGWSIEDDTSLTDSYARLTMTATGTVWKIKSTSNTGSNGGNTDPDGINNNGGSGSGNGSGDQGTGSSGSGSSGSGSSASGGTGGATDTSTGSNENADSATQSLQLAAAIQSVQQAAQQVARQAAGGSDPSSTGLGRHTVPTPAVTGFNPGLALGSASAAGATAGGSPAVPSLSGGLAFVSVNAAPAESTGFSGQASGNTAAAMPEGAGRDPAGFMRVFVVNGGINLPTQASDAAVPGQGVN